jgi:glycolate oxidase subunit GlcD
MEIQTQVDTKIESLRKKLISAGAKSDSIRTDAESKAIYGHDWTQHFDINTCGIAFPETIEQVVAIVHWARTNKIALVPSGGRTGLSGGACALNGELVVSFERMNKVLDFNEVDRTVTCQPGLVTEALQHYAIAKGYNFPVDFAAKGSSHIGGNISTNAGGVKVLRYGATREWVSGIKVVTGAGDILDLNQGLIKNATGLDFRHLFIGSEGVLGFVVEATLKLAPPPKPLTVLVLAVPSLDAIMRIFQLFRTSLPITAFEYFSDIALKYVTASSGLARPFAEASPHYLLIEIENISSDTENEILSAFEQCTEKNWATDGTIAQSEAQSRDFWRLREDISEATSAYQPYKNDISVTISKVPEFLTSVDGLLKKHYPDFEIVWFGHIGDGNMHINILKPANLTKEEFLKKCYGVNDLLFDIIMKMGGSISAEHGVGLTKKPYLQFTKTAPEIELMRGVKKVFDPDGIMNPGKIFD